LVTGRSIALFVHLLGVVMLFVAMGIVQRAGLRVRGSSTVEELRLWLSLAQTTRGMFPAALLFILASGLYVTGTLWSFDRPWIVVAMVTIVVIGIFGGAVVGRGFAAIGGAATSTGPVAPELARIVARPAPWVAATALNGMAIGLLWLMVNKPGWTQSISIVIALGLLGAIVGSVAMRRGTGT
jgi:hypothetical protein